MDAQKVVAILLLVAGLLGLVYGGFTYTSEVHRADIGSLHMTVKEKDYVNIPVWAGVLAIVAGGLLLGKRQKI